jgi:MFS family permease
MYGLKLSLLSLSMATAQLFVGNLTDVSSDSFTFVYIASALLLFPLGVVIHFASYHFKDPAYISIDFKNIVAVLRGEADIRLIIAISFFLQLFFAAMVIYVPLYLSTVVGFSWTHIGIILFAGLMAYVLFEWPIGIIADRYIGEKEMMAVGFVIMAVSVSWFAFLTSTSMMLWMVAMFLSRVGASLVETTTESYFFKHAVSIDTHKISIFRMTNPLGAIAGAALGSVALLFMPLNLLFVALALAMIPGLFLTLFLRDTR